jgi:hypothetical protein
MWSRDDLEYILGFLVLSKNLEKIHMDFLEMSDWIFGTGCLLYPFRKKSYKQEIYNFFADSGRRQKT